MSISHQKPNLIAVVGPTASGKTSLSISLAKKFHGEIVSADSRQIYREMDIGTAKAQRENSESRIQNLEKEKSEYISEGISHHLLDIKNPDEDYSLAEYQRDAIDAIENILKRGHVSFLVGGTG